MSQIQNENAAAQIDPATQRLITRARWLVLLAGATMVIGSGAILGVIGYRVFNAEGSAAVPDLTLALPKGARVVSTAIGDGRITVTIEVGGGVEVRSFDLKTLAPAGRLRLAPQP